MRDGLVAVFDPRTQITVYVEQKDAERFAAMVRLGKGTRERHP